MAQGRNFVEKMFWQGKEWRLAYIPGSPLYVVPAFTDYQIVDRGIQKLPPPFSSEEHPQFLVWVLSRRYQATGTDSQELLSFQVYNQQISIDIKNPAFLNRAAEMVAYLSPNSANEDIGCSLLSAALGIKGPGKAEMSTEAPKPLLTSDMDLSPFLKNVSEVTPNMGQDEGDEKGNEETIK